MLVMTALATFPDAPTERSLGIHRIASGFIETNFKQLTQRAEIVLPRNIADFKKISPREMFKRGHRMVLEFGYDGNYTSRFDGYVTGTSADIPVTIRCEDEMWKVKQLAVNYSNKNVTLEKLLKDICPGYKVDALEGVNLGSVRFPKTTVGVVLDKIQSEFGLYSYMRDKTIHCGKLYAPSTDDSPIPFTLERTVANNGLRYVHGDEIVVKVKGTSLRTKGDKIEYEHGENGGDTLDLKYFNIPTKAELEKLVKADYEKRKVDGFTGSFDAFGIPSVQFGLKAKLTSINYPERNGIYYIEAVTKKFDTGGIRQSITLGGRVPQ